MQQVKEVDLMNNKKLILWLNLSVIPLFFIFFFIFKLCVSSDGQLDEFTIGLLDPFLWLVEMFAIIVIHEGIHGLFFKLFNPKGKVKFGFKQGMAYATSPGSMYSKSKFLIILLAPFVLITFALYGLYVIHWMPRFIFILFAAFHTSACVGDFYFSYLILRTPKGIYVEDTEQGINFYQKRG